MKKINALKVRHRLGEMLEGVFYKNEQFIITRGDKPMAAVIPVTDYESFQHQRKKDFEIIKEIQSLNKKIKSSELESDIDKAIKEVRKRKK